MKKNQLILVLAPLALVAASCSMPNSSGGGLYSDRTHHDTSTTEKSSSSTSEKTIHDSYSYESTEWNSDTEPESAPSSVSIETSTDTGVSSKSIPDVSGYTAVIQLADGASAFEGQGVTIEGDTIRISKVGTYLVSGALSNGNILIDAEKESDTSDEVVLELNGVSITKSGSLANAPIYSKNNTKLKLKKLSKTVNVITDNRTSYDETNCEDSAAVFSNKKLSLTGSGTLTVVSTLNNGIASDTKIESKNGTLNITCPNNGIKAHKSIELGDSKDEGTIVVKSTAGDGIKVDEDKTSELDDGEFAGIKFNKGSYSVTAYDDGIDSAANIFFEDGEGIIKATKTGNNSGAKGVVAELMIHMDGGNYSITSASDDGIHTNGSVKITGGAYTVSAGDDGIHADVTLEILGGNTIVTKAYEGFEALHIKVAGGTTSVTTSDDGWNAAGGSDSQGWGWDGGNVSSDSTPTIEITGGYNYVAASGDGIDSNGNIIVSGGFTVISQKGGANGPVDFGDGSSNYFKQNGGFLCAYGDASMLVASSGSQYSIVTKISSAVSTSNYMVIENGDAKFAIRPQYYQSNSLYISDPSFTAGSVKVSSYTASNVSVGEEKFKGVYSDFTLSGSGTSVYSGTWSTSNVNINNGGGGRPGGGGGPGGRP